METITTTVTIIGAGPSGLATAACLSREGIDYVLLEARDQVGSSWRSHYERLHLHTMRQFSSLPGRAWPNQTPTYPSRAQVVAYLEDYAEEFNIRPRFGESVSNAKFEDGHWQIQTTNGEVQSSALVVATGYNREPKRPEWPGQDTFKGAILHSSEYRNGRDYRGRRALVVGIGNSGGEIAIDLWEAGAETSIAVRSPMHVTPRDLGGSPAQLTGMLMSRLPPRVADRITLAILDRVYGDLSGYGLRRPALGPMTQVMEKGKIPLIDVGTIELIKQGHLRVLHGIDHFDGSNVIMTDGASHSFDLVVLATGYRAALSGFLENAEPHLNERGYPTISGHEAAAPGLYFIGFRNPPTGQLYDISREAPRIANHIRSKHG